MTEKYGCPIEECDVPLVRQARVSEYRSLRLKCIEALSANPETSIFSQLHSLAWHTAVFRTLNESRRLEPHRPVNGALWELTTVGYVNVMAIGIRKLVDRDRRVDSIRYVINQLGKRPELLNREAYVCYDGLAYDYEACRERVLQNRPELPVVAWSRTRGSPDDYDTSERRHETFDVLSGVSGERRRMDSIRQDIFQTLDDELSTTAIKRVVTMTDRVIAHAERIACGTEEVEIPTYDDIDTALQALIRVANFLSATVLDDAVLGNPVPTPQFDVLEDLDQPWTATDTLPALNTYWHELSESFERASRDFEGDMLRAR